MRIEERKLPSKPLNKEALLIPTTTTTTTNRKILGVTCLSGVHYHHATSYLSYPPTPSSNKPPFFIQCFHIISTTYPHHVPTFLSLHFYHRLPLLAPPPSDPSKIFT